MGSGNFQFVKIIL